MQEHVPYDAGVRRSRTGVRARASLTVARPFERRAFSIARHEGPWRDALLRRMLALADLAAGLVATASLLVAGESAVSTALWVAIFAPVWIVVAKLLGLYDRDQRSLRHLTVDELPNIFMWALVGAATIALLVAATPVGWLKGSEVLRLGVVSAATAVVLRITARAVWRRLTPPESAVLIGNGGAAAAVRRKLQLFPDIHVSIAAEREALSGEDLLSPLPQLVGADRILLVSPPLDEELMAALVAFCRRHAIKLSVIPSVRALFGTGVALRHVADLPVLEYNTWDVSRSTQLLKRLLDLVVSFAALVVLSPFLLLIAALVLIDSGRPILFTQVRAGQDARPFTMLKFRTMVQDAEQKLGELLSLEMLGEPVFKLRGDPRVTRFGRLLRRTSIDELPQLVNVLVGQMSLVGPRPEQVDLVAQYAPDHLFRLAVKPGMTGPMQVYGRGELTFDERLAVEREYVENLAVGRDLHILALTIASLLHGRGAF